MIAWEPTAMGFLLVLFRCGGLFSVAPIFGTRAVPSRVRMALAVSVALIAFQAAGAPRFVAWDQIGPLIVAILGETIIIGLAAGMASRFSIDAAAAAGHAAGLSMGIGFSAVIDPINGADSNALSQLFSFAALGVALTAGIHHEIILWLCRTIIETPPGQALSVPELTSTVVGEAARAAALSVRLAFPIMAAVILGYVALGLLGRTAPAMNLSNVGFAIALLCGAGAVYMVAPLLAELAARSARTVFVGG
jgi:flagellar biosynthesis protein FliR